MQRDGTLHYTEGCRAPSRGSARPLRPGLAAGSQDASRPVRPTRIVGVVTRVDEQRGFHVGVLSIDGAS